MLIRAVLAGLALALTVGAGGCTARDRPILALAAPDGRPTALLISCGGFASVSVYADGGAPATFSWQVTTDSTVAGVMEIPLLDQAPTGWRGSGPAVQPLQAGVRYALGGRAGASAILVRFTTDDLDQIPADQVLAPSGRDRARLMPRSRFEAAARDACP